MPNELLYLTQPLQWPQHSCCNTGELCFHNPGVSIKQIVDILQNQTCMLSITIMFYNYLFWCFFLKCGSSSPPKQYDIPKAVIKTTYTVKNRFIVYLLLELNFGLSACKPVHNRHNNKLQYNTWFLRFLPFEHCSLLIM